MSHDMTCDEVRERTVDLLRAGKDPRADAALAGHIAQCRVCAYETDAVVSAWGALDEFETASGGVGADVPFWAAQAPRRSAHAVMLGLAALGLVLAGFVGGFAASGRSGVSADVAQLRDELYRTQDVLIANLANLNSASAQLGALNTVRGADALDPRLLQAIGELAQDAGNANVRVAALEMLLLYSDQPAAVQPIAQIREQCDPLLCALLDHWQGGSEQL
jgi:hypothetical protein